MSLLDQMYNSGGPPQVQPGAPTFAQIQSGPGMVDPQQLASAGPALTPSAPRNALQSFFHRLNLARQNVGEGLTPTPQHLVDSGLISPEDVANAKKGNLLRLGLGMLSEPAMGTFGQALAHGVTNMQQGYQQQLQEPIQQGLEAFQVGQQSRIMQARELASRLFPIDPNDSPSQRAQKLQGQYQLAAQVGDTEMVKNLGDTLKGTFENATKPMEIEWKDTGNQLVPTNKYTGQPIPWLQPMPKGMSDDAKSYRDSQQALAQANAGSERESRLVSQYNEEIKPHVLASRQIQSAYAAMPGAAKHDITAEQELLYNALNLAHPGQQVPRNEIQNYQGSVGPIGNVSKLFQKVTNGKGGALLTDDQVKQLSALVRSAHQNELSNVAPIMSDYTHRAKRWGVDSSVFVDPTETLPSLTNPLDHA